MSEPIRVYVCRRGPNRPHIVLTVTSSRAVADLWAQDPDRIVSVADAVEIGPHKADPVPPLACTAERTDPGYRAEEGLESSSSVLTGESGTPRTASVAAGPIDGDSSLVCPKCGCANRSTCRVVCDSPWHDLAEPLSTKPLPAYVEDAILTMSLGRRTQERVRIFRGVMLRAIAEARASAPQVAPSDEGAP